MKSRLRHIAYAWVVLICFAAGQITAFSHQHTTSAKPAASVSAKNAIPTPTVKEKCYVCDAMHHTHMVIFSNHFPSVKVSVVDTRYTFVYHYQGIALILSAGRSPPQA